MSDPVHKKFKLLGGRTVKDPPSVGYQASPNSLIFAVFEVNSIWLEEDTEAGNANIATFHEYLDFFVDKLNDVYP